MHQLEHGFHSLRQALMTECGIMSQDKYLGILEHIGGLLQQRVQVAPAIVACVQLQLKLRDHGIENPLHLHVIDAAIHQHPLHRHRISGEALELLQDRREKTRNFSGRHGDGIRIAYADLGSRMCQHLDFRAQMPRQNPGSLVFRKQSLAPNH